MSSPTSLDELLLYRMTRLNAIAGGMVVRLCEGRFGITRREWRMVAVLAEQGALSSSEVAERAHLDRARTSKALTSLQDKKLVERRPGPGDRRRAMLSLTDEGRGIYDALFPLVTRIHDQLLSVLSSDENAQFDAMLSRLMDEAQRMRATAVLPKATRGQRRA